MNREEKKMVALATDALDFLSDFTCRCVGSEKRRATLIYLTAVDGAEGAGNGVSDGRREARRLAGKPDERCASNTQPGSRQQ